jgi:hypothetical protein
MPSKQHSSRIAVITVHGTNDGAETIDGEKWWQRGSAFSQRLQQGLSQRGMESDIAPFRWSGANNALEREKASERLATTIRRTRRDYDKVHVIGHSHGGNVANDAAVLLRWGARRAHPPIATLTTVGTPFLRTRLTAFQVWGAYIFLFVACLALLAWLFYAAIWAMGLLSLAVAGFHFDVTAMRQSAVPGVILALFAIAVGYMLREAIKGVRRVFRLGRGAAPHATIFSIWHPADEAIALLRAAEQVEIEPLPPRSLVRASRADGILWAVRIVTVLALLWAAGLVFAGRQMVEACNALLDSDHLDAPFYCGAGPDFATLSTLTLVFVLAAAPLLLGAIYLIYRLVVGYLGEWLVRPLLNGAIGDVLRGMAFGSVGDQKPGAVETSSHTFGSKNLELSGALAERMLANSAEASMQLLQKYRKEIFNVHGNQAELFEQIPRDAMTWQSLIHTTYFDVSELAEAVADHIAPRV